MTQNTNPFASIDTAGSNERTPKIEAGLHKGLTIRKVKKLVGGEYGDRLIVELVAQDGKWVCFTRAIGNSRQMSATMRDFNALMDAVGIPAQGRAQVMIDSIDPGTALCGKVVDVQGDAVKTSGGHDFVRLNFRKSDAQANLRGDAPTYVEVPPSAPSFDIASTGYVENPNAPGWYYCLADVSRPQLSLDQLKLGQR